MLNITTAETIINEMTTYDLADLAEIGTPHNTEAEEFLNSIRDAILDRAENSTQNGYTLNEDDITEMADSAIPVYTYNKWETYNGLNAHCEDVSDYLPDGTTDAEEIANAAIYIIAERLLNALKKIIDENTDEEDENEDGE